MILLAAAPSVVVAATLPIDGTYGDKTSCEWAKTNEYSERDDVLLLSPDGVQTMMTACSFDSISKVGALYKLAMTCGSEGEGPEGNYADSAELSGDAASGLMLRFANGSSWGALKRCT